MLNSEDSQGYRCGGSSFQSNYKTVPLGWRRVALGIYNPSPSISIKGADRMYNFFNGYKFLNIPATKRTSSVWEADCFDQQNTANLYHAIFEAMGSNPCNSHLVPLRCLLQGCFLLELRCLFEWSSSHKKGPCVGTWWTIPAEPSLNSSQTRLRYVSEHPARWYLPTYCHSTLRDRIMVSDILISGSRDKPPLTESGSIKKQLFNTPQWREVCYPA